MRHALAVSCICLLFLSSNALAQPAGSWDFDNMPVGPWGGTVVSGDGSLVRVVNTADGASGGAGLPTGASGNMLCIDARNTTSPIIIRFTYNCLPGVPNGVCRVRYGYSAAVWVFGGGFGVYVDDSGAYNNPDDLYQPPVGFPPSTSFGSNSETANDCLANHTIDFVVQPGTIMYLDDFTFECLDPIPTEQDSWSGVKGLYR